MIQLNSWKRYTNRSTYSTLQHLALPYLESRQSNDQKLTSSPGCTLTHRSYSITTKRENPLIIGGVSVLAIAGGVHIGMILYKQYQEKQASAPPEEPTTTNTSNTSSNSAEETTNKTTSDNKTEESSSSFFGNFFATTFYDGGFEEKMTKREAALILGVRESASVERIKDAHRRILINNHPDRGGSPYIAAKVNEAKDFLLKGKPNV